MHMLATKLHRPSRNQDLPPPTLALDYQPYSKNVIGSDGLQLNPRSPQGTRQSYTRLESIGCGETELRTLEAIRQDGTCPCVRPPGVAWVAAITNESHPTTRGDWGYRVNTVHRVQIPGSWESGPASGQLGQVRKISRDAQASRLVHLLATIHHSVYGPRVASKPYGIKTLGASISTNSGNLRAVKLFGPKLFTLFRPGSPSPVLSIP
jgi:hypothetical protein